MTAIYFNVLVKCFPEQLENCYRFHQDGMAKNFYENHIHKLACDEDNYACSQFIGRASNFYNDP